MSRTLPVLSIAQAFSQTAAPVIVLLGGIVGTRLAPSHDLATLPVAFMIIGTAITTIPAALLMSRIGRKTDLCCRLWRHHWLECWLRMRFPRVLLVVCASP